MSSNLSTYLKNIANLITENSHIMEIGCGDGELLAYLSEHKKVDGRGIEIVQSDVRKCV
jgi:cyclopropane fatty-acyl-phospholipid synthase-like methyltransferase